MEFNFRKITENLNSKTDKMIQKLLKQRITQMKPYTLLFTCTLCYLSIKLLKDDVVTFQT